MGETVFLGRCRTMRPLHANLILASSTVVLSVASLIVVFQNASDEPYTGFRKSDAVVQVVVATALGFSLAWAY